MATKTEEYANLVQQLVASTDALDIALGLAAPIHSLALSYAYYVLGALAAVSILISSIRERLVADTGALRSAIVSLLVAAVVVGYRVDYHQAVGRPYDEVRQKLVENYQSKPVFFDESYYNQHTATRYEMSWVIVYAHRFVTHFLGKFIVMTNEMVGKKDDSGNVAIPMWAWEAWHSGIASDLDDTPVGALYGDYLHLCSGVAMANSQVSQEEWRKVGLIGGVGFFEDGEVNIDSDATSLVSEAPWEGVGKDANSAYEVLRQTLPSGGPLASPRDGGYYVPSEAFWRAKTAGHEDAKEFIDVPVERLKYQPGMIQPTPSPAMFKKAFYPVTCLDMYYTAALAFREFASAGKSASRSFMHSTAGKVLNARWEDELNAMYRIGLRRYKASLSSDLTSTVRSFSKVWDQFQLSLFVPTVIGTMALLYAFLVALSPVVVAFSVIPGRSGTVGVYLNLFAYVGVVLFLEYFLLAMGTALMASLTVSIGASVEAYDSLIDNLAPFAVAIESMMVGGALGVLYLAKLLVFADKKNIAGALNSGMIAEPERIRKMSEGATIAATTMVASKGLGAMRSGPPGPPAVPAGGGGVTIAGGDAAGGAFFREIWPDSPSSGPASLNPNQLKHGIDIDGDFLRHAEAKGNLSAPSRRMLPSPKRE